MIPKVSTAPCIFRRAAPDDLPIVRALACAIWPVCYGPILPPRQIPYMLDRMYSLEQLRDDLAAGITYTFLIENDLPIAFGAHGPDPGHPHMARLHKLYLLPSRQHRGLGSLLLQHILHLAAGERFTALTLRVNKHNVPAIAAYRRNGFSITGGLVTDIGEGFVMDDYVMTRPLP
jgi:GNAT superfamily N-acetyltransferase